ncbi:MAG TPA: peptidylprolyl isomerase [Miltoncostaeaceae bacterium]|nr:peptidylprolyl isomerase [Miltoncostaeaceae bacterium]
MTPGRILPTLAAGALALGVLTACSDDDPAAGGTPAGTTAPGLARDTSVVPGCRTDPPEQVPPKRTYENPPPMSIDTARTYTATLDTSCGTIVIRLDARAAPRTVNNFVFLARERFYDGLPFHRVVRDYVIQTGDPRGDGSGDAGYEFGDELPDDGYPPGAVAMANAGPDTNGSQFFIVTGDASFLDNLYSRFGRVVRGLEAARRIESLAPPDVPPGDPSAEVPRQPAFIYSVRISEG